MPDWNTTDRAVLLTYPKHVVYLRRQFRDERLGLVFGTGLTQELGIPGWHKLNEEVASDTRVAGQALLGDPSKETVKTLLDTGSYMDIVRLLGSGPEETIITQRLYEHFKSKQYRLADCDKHHSLQLNADIQRQWRAIIREKLYGADADASSDGIAKKLLKKHPYLRFLLPIVRRMPLTVTYNFDDVLELVLAGDRAPEDKEQQRRGRGYETTIDIRKPARNRRGVIYHPNGYIPRNTMEGGYEGIVLSEDEFADRMIETMTGQHASLSHHFLRSTCFFVGLSLKDGILKNMLRQIAQVTPGHYHYYIHYCEEGQKPPKEEQDAITACNFGTYNLITLFLTNAEIASLGRLITDGYDANDDSVSDGEFTHLADEVGVKAVYHYYIVGAVGAGKTTVVSHLRDLVTHDEWVEDRLPELAEDWVELDKDEPSKAKRERVDNWLMKQFKQKNHILLEETIGLVVSDRCPLDPLAFTLKSEWRAKARLLLDTICPGQTKAQICPGQIIYLENDPNVLDLRVRRTNKKYRIERLKQMQRDVEHIYSMSGVITLNTRLKPLSEVMQQLARIIHMGKYAPANLHGRLVSVKNDGYIPPLFDPGDEEVADAKES